MYTAATVHILSFPLLDVVVEVVVGSLLSVLRRSRNDEVDSTSVELLVGIVVIVVVGIVDEAVVETSAEVVGAKKNV